MFSQKSRKPSNGNGLPFLYSDSDKSAEVGGMWKEREEISQTLAVYISIGGTGFVKYKSSPLIVLPG
jgi:hypothetical protein